MTSELRVDNLKGSTTGGSINVLGEGTSATTNLQQGLCKAWIRFNFITVVALYRDSFNVTSLQIMVQVIKTIDITNAFGNNDNYAHGLLQVTHQF